ncbi:MAG: hypothetical protein Q9219_004961 [cf. Caloplaca sp. 3 TL-2023]
MSHIVDQLESTRTALRFNIFDPQNWLSVSKRQETSALNAEAKGPIWVSRVVLSPPADDDVRQALFQAIDGLASGLEVYEKPVSSPVEGEWIGRRRKVSAQASEPNFTEREKYNGLMKDVAIQLTQGRCFSLKYRLSPQHPFPSALLDLLLAYLSLLYPQRGPSTYHSPIPADNIVLAGDSVGANLCLGHIQTILYLARLQSRSPPVVRWNGVDVSLALPSGVALISPWFDQTYSLPSFKDNQKTDYIPGYSITSAPGFPQCRAWPTDPPRGDAYCDKSCLVHPLVCPVAGEDWRGSPPMLMLCGEEVASDGAKLVMQQLYEQKVKVRWRQFERLPHVFISLMHGLEHSRIAMTEWAGFCRGVVESREDIRSGGEFIGARDLSRSEIDLGKFTDLTREDALKLMRKRQRDMRDVRRETPDKPKMRWVRLV